MRKSKKRVIAIIICCFVLATFCVGVFADETTQEDNIDPAMNRVGTVLNSTPYDLGELVVNYDDSENYNVTSGYYIIKVITGNNPGSSYNYYQFDGSSARKTLFGTYNDVYYCRYVINDVSPTYDFIELENNTTYYIYVYVERDYNVFRSSDYNDVSLSIYSISNRSVIDSVYSNSQDVHSSLVSVINEATNVITTNNVVMMFCILIPVISFGAGILIRLRKRA